MTPGSPVRSGDLDRIRYHDGGGDIPFDGESRMNVLSLFSGIGGLELGLERAGMTVVGQVEIDPFCRRVLAKHWPEVPRHDDVRTAVAWWLDRARPAVDVVAGGFPCQPFSNAGHKRGIADERWGWPWMADVVRAVRPRFVVMENVGCPCPRSQHHGWGCPCGCPVPIHALSITPVRRI